ncbi:MAG: hypothetical protein V1652_02030 [bacterium]
MPREIIIFRTRGGCIIHSILKYVLFPLVIAIGPAILINLFVIQNDISQPFFLFIIVFIAIFIGALLFHIAVHFWVVITLKKNGILTGRIIEPGGRFRRFSVDVNEATKASFSTQAGAPFCLYKKNKVLIVWNSQTIGTVNMNAFLRALREANPLIDFDEATQHFFEEGGFTSIERGLLYATVPLILAILLVFYIPTVELVLYQHLVGGFNWMQEVLQDLFYFTLSPFLAVGFVVFFAKIIERRPLIKDSKKDFVHLIAAGLIILFSTVGGVNHVLHCIDFLGRPQALYEQQTKGVKVIWQGAKEGAISFGLVNVPDYSWNMYMPIGKMVQTEQALHDPVTVVYTSHLKTLIKVENTYSHTLIYKKQSEHILLPSYFHFNQ